MATSSATASACASISSCSMRPVSRTPNASGGTATSSSSAASEGAILFHDRSVINGADRLVGAVLEPPSPGIRLSRAARSDPERAVQAPPLRDGHALFLVAFAAALGLPAGPRGGADEGHRV